MSQDLSGAVMLIILLGVLLSVGIWSTAAAVDEQSTDTFETETVTVDEGWIDLSADADRYYNETVTQHDEQLTRSDEYFWDADDGRIAFNESQVSGDVNVSYSASTMPEETAAFVSVLEPLWRIGAVLPLIALGGAVFAGLTYLRQQNNGGAY